MNSFQNWKEGMWVRKYKVIILPLAEQDITNNVDYLFCEKAEPEVALNLMEGFRNTIQKLRFMPERHEMDEDEELATLQMQNVIIRIIKFSFAL